MQDVFRLGTIIIIVSLPLILLLRKPKQAVMQQERAPFAALFLVASYFKKFVRPLKRL